MKLWLKILIGFVLGAVTGLVVGPSVAVIKPLGDLFIRLIKMLIIPMVFCSLVVGASSIGDLKKLGRVGVKTLVYFMSTTAIAVVIGLVMAIVVNPSAGFVLAQTQKYEAKPLPSVVDTLLNLIPTNPVQAMATDNVLQVIAFALFVGVAIALLGDKGKPVHAFCDSMAEVSYRITGMIMEFAPVGVFALMAWVTGTTGTKALIPLAKLIFTSYAATILHAVVVYSGACYIWARMSPVTFFKGFFEAMAVAFSTCSSNATLPISMRCAQENLGVPKEISSFVQPLGATINMDGTAIYQAVAACFIAGVYGIPLGMQQYLMIILVATLASIGTAGVPGAGMIMLSMVLQAIGLPLDGIMLVAGIDRVLDMIRTCMNVTGDAAGAVVVAATEHELVRVPAGTAVSGR